jgi:broad specificity phosphatase PhoE
MTAADLQLVLVRHGETEWTERGLLHGRLDSPLSPTGARHAALAAERLRGEAFAALYTSPQGRALQTAEILGERLGLAPVPLDGLREMDFGWLEGKSLRHVDPDGRGARILRPMVHLISRLTAERPEQFTSRVKSAVETMRTQHPHGRLLVVTHWGTLSLLFALLIEGSPRNWRRYGPWHACGISELHAVNGAWQIAYINDYNHLIEMRQV